jgi:hypothetical protein
MGIDRIYVQNQLINEDNMEISYIYICVCVLEDEYIIIYIWG